MSTLNKLDTLVSHAVKWTEAVSAHRAKIKAYGKVTFDVVDTPKGREIHLREETSFKEGPDPMKAALIWIDKQRAERVLQGSQGSLTLESGQKDGITTWARVVEVTIISAQTS